jgi:betaine-aldehyde dehydrogenase
VKPALQSSLFHTAVMKCFAEIRAGTVWINDHNRLYPEVEMGGFRESGYGRLHGRQALAEFQSMKHIYQRHGRV